MAFTIPQGLAASCRESPEARAWLDQLPQIVDDLRRQWSLQLGPPFDGPEMTASWVAPARRSDGSPAILKVPMPHMEADHEIEGLRFWDGSPTVELLEADDALGAMLLESCRPGTSLRSQPEVEQDVIIARLLRRMWRVPPPPHPFRPLKEMIDLWIAETRSNEARWHDARLVRNGLRTFEELARSDEGVVLLATDLHAGNVLQAEREPWLVIDPKPFIGDPAYDATQHLLNCESRMVHEPIATIASFADRLHVDGERVRLWLFARTAAENRDDWEDSWTAMARLLSG